MKLLVHKHVSNREAAEFFGKQRSPKRGGTDVLVLTVEGMNRLKKFEGELAERFMRWLDGFPPKDEIRRIAPQDPVRSVIKMHATPRVAFFAVSFTFVYRSFYGMRIARTKSETANQKRVGVPAD